MEFQVNKAELGNITAEKTGLIPISLKISDLIIPNIDISPRGKLKFITSQISVSSIGTKSITITCPSNKRYVPLYSMLYSDLAGVWSTNNGTICLINGTGVFVIQKNTTDVNSSTAYSNGDIFNFTREFSLLPGDSIKTNQYVNAYTSVGIMYLTLAVLEFDLI